MVRDDDTLINILTAKNIDRSIWYSYLVFQHILYITKIVLQTGPVFLKDVNILTVMKAGIVLRKHLNILIHLPEIM